MEVPRSKTRTCQEQELIFPLSKDKFMKSEEIKVRKYLDPKTAEVLSSLSEMEEIKNFTLVGGSALSLQLHHRISEDLDFFTWHQKLDTAGIAPILKNIAAIYPTKIINNYTDGIDLIINGVKVTFFANNWDKLKERESLLNNSFIGRLELITAMKTNALSLRATFRDYYDLYVITNQIFDINKVFEIALEYIPGMTKKIFAIQLVYTEDIEDENIKHLSPAYDLSLTDIRIFFENEIKKLLAAD